MDVDCSAEKVMQEAVIADPVEKFFKKTRREGSLWVQKLFNTRGHFW